jgi:ribosomal protein RSM22 (predicted rRNA methylase)
MKVPLIEMTQMRLLKVKILTKNNLQISGTLKTSLALDNNRFKLPDLLNNSRTFVDLFDVAVYRDEQLMTKMASLCLNKSAIAFLVEEESALSSRKDSEMPWLITK